MKKKKKKKRLPSKAIRKTNNHERKTKCLCVFEVVYYFLAGFREKLRFLLRRNKTRVRIEFVLCIFLLHFSCNIPSVKLYGFIADDFHFFFFSPTRVIKNRWPANRTVRIISTPYHVGTWKKNSNSNITKVIFFFFFTLGVNRNAAVR